MLTALTEVRCTKVVASSVNETPIKLYQVSSLIKAMKDDMVLEEKREVHLAVCKSMFVEDDKW